MRILDFLVEDAIKINLEAKSKEEVIKELVKLLKEAGKISDEKKALQILMEREELGSTGVGQGVAIPHGKTIAVSDLVSAFGLSKEGVDFDALDGAPVHLFFLLLAPEGAAGSHLKALARISSLLKDKYFRKALIDANSSADVLKIIREEEELRH